jgi:hypothetical protein
MPSHEGLLLQRRLGGKNGDIHKARLPVRSSGVVPSSGTLSPLPPERSPRSGRPAELIVNRRRGCSLPSCAVIDVPVAGVSRPRWPGGAGLVGPDSSGSPTTRKPRPRWRSLRNASRSSEALRRSFSPTMGASRAKRPRGTQSMTPNRLRLSVLLQARGRAAGGASRRPRAPDTAVLRAPPNSRRLGEPGLHSLPSRRPNRRAGGRLSGRWLSSGQPNGAHPLRTPDRWMTSPSAPVSRCGRRRPRARHAFAMRRSGVRIASAPPPQSPADLREHRSLIRRHGRRRPPEPRGRSPCAAWSPTAASGSHSGARLRGCLSAGMASLSGLVHYWRRQGSGMRERC